MPLVTMRCCGKEPHEYEAILSTSFDDPDASTCPICGAISERVWSVTSPTVKKEKEASDYDPLELEEHLEAKAYYESEDFQSRMQKGEAGLIVRGPQFLRPRIQERRFY